MAPLNTFTGQQTGRPAARAQQQQEPQHPGQHPTWGQPQAPHPQAVQQQGQWGQQASQGYAPGYGQLQDAHGGAGYGQPGADQYAPQFEPYGAAAAQTAPRAAQQTYQQQPGYAPAPKQNWPGAQPDPRGYDAGSYMTPAQAAAAQASAAYRTAEYEQAPADWQQGQGYQGQGYHQDHAEPGFAQAAGGELDANYGEEEHDYEAEDAPRSRRPMMIAAALAGAIIVGGGLAYGYKTFLGGGATGQPPVIKSADSPSKTKPADAGGKQFAHTDSKIMGRLGDGSAAGAAGMAAAGDVDANGTRKVSTLVVGRDGSIQAPPVAEAAAPAPADAAAGVPGMMVVDALAGQKSQSAAAAIAVAAPAAPQPAEAAPAAPQSAPQKVAVAPPVAPVEKPIVIAKAATPAVPKAQLPAATGSIEPQAVAPAPVKKPVVKKVAAAAPAAAAPVSNSVATTGSGSNGFVAVLASVPRSNTSRLDALKRFADMQQKYGSVLSGKTPDVAEANLGTKGAYHRLVVGPPGSREQASTVCSQLKTQGYADCWVTSY